MAPDPQVPFRLQFAAGAVAGVTEVLIMYPLDVIKTRLQLQHGAGPAALPEKRYHGMLDCGRKIVRHEGFSRLYRGILAPILMEAPKRATKFAANESWGKFYRGLFDVQTMDQKLAILTGASAGSTEACVIVPFELVKVRMQDPAHAQKYRNMADCVAQIIKHEGPHAFFQGFESTLWRSVVWNAGYFGCIFQVRSLLLVADSKSRGMMNDLVAGSVGGTVGTLLNTPLDVVKSRIQSSQRSAGITPKYNWAWPAVATILSEEGPRALYKGLMPKIVRFCPGGGVLLVVYTAMVDVFARLNNV